jgi:hypothetical protein
MSKRVKRNTALLRKTLPLIHQKIGCVMAKLGNYFYGNKVVLSVKKFMLSCGFVIVLPVKIPKASNQKFQNISHKIGIWYSRWTFQELFPIKSRKDTEVCSLFLRKLI